MIDGIMMYGYWEVGGVGGYGGCSMFWFYQVYIVATCIFYVLIILPLVVYVDAVVDNESQTSSCLKSI